MRSLELIEEIDGWKLELTADNKFQVTTSNGFKQLYNTVTYSVGKFREAVRRGWIWVDVDYYLGAVEDSEMKINKKSKQIQSNNYQLFLDGHITSEKVMKEKLEPIIKRAEDKFDNINEKLKKLMEDEDCDISYMINGDTYGIDEDYMYISFRIDGIFCIYRIEE